MSRRGWNGCGHVRQRAQAFVIVRTRQYSATITDVRYCEAAMPSKSPAQHRLMEAAAHTPGGVGGVPQKVGAEFTAADARGFGVSQPTVSRRLLRDGLKGGGKA